TGAAGSPSIGWDVRAKGSPSEPTGGCCLMKPITKRMTTTATAIVPITSRRRTSSCCRFCACCLRTLAAMHGTSRMRWSSPGKPITRLQPVQPIDFFLTVAAPSYNTKYENYEHGDFARHARGGGADVQRGVIVVLMLVLALTAASCGGLRPWRAPAEPAEPLPEPPVRLVTTVYALAEFSRAVGGDRVAVELL